MMEALKTFLNEFNLKSFYSIVLSEMETATLEVPEDAFIQIAPFIRQFHSRFSNYYKLLKRPPLKDGDFQNRCEEIYTGLCRCLLNKPIEEVVDWILSLKADEEVELFPSRPVPDNYQNIMRGLTVLIELCKGFDFSKTEVPVRMLEFVEGILAPDLDNDLEEKARILLDELNNFDARREGTGSEKMDLLTEKIEELNRDIKRKIISNNTFVSIVQQITEINKALKTVRRKDFMSVLGNRQNEVERFWDGMKDHGYSGGDNYLYGDFQKVRSDLMDWLDAEFPDRSEIITAILEETSKARELPPLEKGNIPDAMQLYAINLLGTAGLTSKEAIQLVLGFHTRFVERSVREGAYLALKQNTEYVQDYFLTALGQEPDYDQQLVISDLHDSIFDHISATLLTKTFGDAFAGVLKELEEITTPDGILLSNFIRSAYMRFSEPQVRSDEAGTGENLRLDHFKTINSRLIAFKSYLEQKSEGIFISLVRMWGLNYVVSWSQTDYEAEERLFRFIIQAAEGYPASEFTTMDSVIPLQDIIMLLTQEPDARQLIQKLMTFLLNSKISFDYRLFSSLFRVVAMRNQQLEAGITIRDGFSEQRGYSVESGRRESESTFIELEDPHIFHPIVIFLITVLHMKAINIPKDAFVETDISLYLNSLAERQKNPELGYQMYLAHELISSIPYIKDFSSHHETIIRKTIADLDEWYKRKNILIHYHRIKIHRAPSKLDLDFCLEILEGLSERSLDVVLKNLSRLMKGIGDEAIPDLQNYFDFYAEKLTRLGNHLQAFKQRYPSVPWQEIAEDSDFKRKVRDLPDIDIESSKDIIALVELANALSNYWTQKISDDFLDTHFTESDKAAFRKASWSDRLATIRRKRREYQSIVNRFDPDLEPYQHIFLKRHVIQGDWNFDFFGFWPYYKETKFELYNADRKFAGLELELLENRVIELREESTDFDTLSGDVLDFLRANISCLSRLMVHLVDDGLAPSKYFMDTIDVLDLDQLTISQLHDILGILTYRELSHIDTFFATTFGHFPARITQALGRENLDFGLDTLSSSDDELLYPLVQETVLGNIMAEARCIHILEEHLNRMLRITSELKQFAPSEKIFRDEDRPIRPLSPVFEGYKSYALQTLAADGFNVPALETFSVPFFKQHPELLEPEHISEFKTHIIERLLQLEEKTGKLFDFVYDTLTDEQCRHIEAARTLYEFDTESAQQLLVSARSGSYRSMPGILGTVLNIGYRDITRHPVDNGSQRFALNTYRMFLSTFGNVAYDISESLFSRIVEDYKRKIPSIPGKKVKWEDLSDEMIRNMIFDFRSLIEEHAARDKTRTKTVLNWDDPLELLAESIIGVWDSWNSSAAINLRKFLEISPDWHTPVTLMEMKQADRNSRSFSAILFSGDPQGKINTPHGDLLFGRPGEDIASGLASEGIPLESIEQENPELYRNIADLLERVKINKGYVNVDVEMVGEYDPKTDSMELFVVQERQMPLGARSESEDYRLTPTDTDPVAAGKGVNGGAQHGVFLDGILPDYYALKETVRETREKLGEKDKFHGPAIFLLMKYVTPAEALKMNIDGVDGVVTTKIGKSSHASIAAKRDGKLFICESTITERDNEWFFGEEKIGLGNEPEPDLYTVVGHPKSISPYSGNIYSGRMPLTRVMGKK